MVIDIKLQLLYTTGYNEATNDLTVYTSTLENEETDWGFYFLQLIASFNFAQVRKDNIMRSFNLMPFVTPCLAWRVFSFDLKFEKDH